MGSQGLGWGGVLLLQWPRDPRSVLSFLALLCNRSKSTYMRRESACMAASLAHPRPGAGKPLKSLSHSCFTILRHTVLLEAEEVGSEQLIGLG